MFGIVIYTTFNSKVFHFELLFMFYIGQILIFGVSYPKHK